VTAQLRIIYAGTPEFAVRPLQALLADGHSIAAVYTQPDRPAGRGRQVAMSAVKQCALEHGLPVEQPPTLRDPAAVQRLAAFNADLMVVAAYGLLLPQAVLATPRLGCINIHASLLPRWRGAAPIQRAILAGDVTTGITIMRMDAGLDTGPMLLERSIDISPDETAASLHDRLSLLGAAALLDALPGIADGSLAERPQPTEGATHAAKIRKEEASIDWQQPAQQIERLVRAFNPWPIAETYWKDRQLRVWQAGLVDAAHSAPPGQVVDAGARGLLVATGSGLLALARVQLAGGKVLAAADFLNAHRIVGATLGRLAT
jgi:methionyl-tRNA formyltransferase